MKTLRFIYPTFAAPALAWFTLLSTADRAFGQVNVSDENSLRSAILNAAPGETINVSAGTITLHTT